MTYKKAPELLLYCKICNSPFYGNKSRVYCDEACGYTGRLQIVRETNARRYASLQRFLKAVKSTCGCVDCGYRENIYALQFDHVGEKKNKVASMNMIRMAVVELEKCEVRCANCHAIKTQERYECAL